MTQPKRSRIRALIALIPALISAYLPMGCATIMREETQTFVVSTRPEGGSVQINGATVRDGESYTYRRDPNPPKANVAVSGPPRYQNLQFAPDPWLLGDLALCIPFIIPGIAALIIDSVTGAWRLMDERQIFHLVTESTSQQTNPDEEPSDKKPPPRDPDPDTKPIITPIQP